MSAVTRFLGRVFGAKAAEAKPSPPPSPPKIGASYDAARTGQQNRNHWANADDIGPASANWSDTRGTLRVRARYERDNDPNLNGLGKTLSVDMLGTGPRLQLNVPVKQYDAAGQVARSFKSWMRASGMLEKFRLMIEPAPFDGETFAQIILNPLIDHPIKLDLRVMETEQIATPNNFDPNLQFTDGIEFDQFGNPTFYHVLKEHPGESSLFSTDYDRVPAKNMLHWFRPSRPGQPRGVSEFAPSLQGSSQTRRYSRAALTAAEYAASISGVLTSNASASSSTEDTGIEAMDEVESPVNQLLTLPEGWGVTQLKAEQPTQNYCEFVADKRAESGRPVLAPRNVATGDSSPYNFTSARMDHTVYQRMIWVQRERFRVVVLDKLFRAWLEEAEIKGALPAELGDWRAWDWDWHWDGFAFIDPLKESNAVELRLKLNLTTLSEECAAEGKDWREVIDQRAVERQYLTSKGMSPDVESTPIAPPGTFPSDDVNDPSNPDDTTLEEPANRRPAYAR